MRSVVIVPRMANAVGLNPGAGALRVLLVKVSQNDPRKASKMESADNLEDELFPINFLLMAAIASPAPCQVDAIFQKGHAPAPSR